MTEDLLKKKEIFFEIGREGDQIIKKIDYCQSPKKILRKIDNYYKDFRMVGINVPDYYGGKVLPKENKIITKWSDSGEPLLLKIKSLKKINVIKTLNQVLNINLWAYYSELPIVPLLNCFTEKNSTVFYVNFYPPLSYKKILKSKGINRTIFSLNFLGLVQKIAVPVREYIALRPELKNEIVKLADIFLYQIGCDEVKKDYHQIFNYKFKKEFNQDKKKSFDGYEKIYHFDPGKNIISFSPKSIWTAHLLYRDLEMIKKFELN